MAVVEKKRGRPKGTIRSSKCRKCSKNSLPCGASCPYPPDGPSADAAASEEAAVSRSAAASGDGHGVQTPLHGGSVMAPPSLGTDEATPADGPGLSAAHGSSSTAGSAELTKRLPRPRNLDAEAPEAPLLRDQASIKRLKHVSVGEDEPSAAKHFKSSSR